MSQEKAANGQDLKEMFMAATNWLEKSTPDIDALNVFPVPDGDTGTNMLLTMRSSVEEASQTNNLPASATAKALARGALMGARGNSGVILSQIWSGLAEGLADKETFKGKELAEALQQASDKAYKGLSNPVEGTILTVIREAATAAQAHVAGGDDSLIMALEVAVNTARESVANTPTLLPVLKEAGVVDAGGQGLYTILEGALRYLKGEVEQMQFRKPQIIVSNIPLATRLPQMVAAEEVPYGYCTEFLLKVKEGGKLSPDKIRKRLNKKGESLIVVGDESTVRIHIHALEPGDVVNYVTSLGTLHQVSMRNMDEQHQDFMEMQRDRGMVADTGIIAVAAGEGLAEVLQSLGVASIVPGGQTMNPSTKDILKAVDAVPSDKIIILPNNSNIVLTAEQVHSVTDKTIRVVPTETIPQGIAALLAFDYEADLETNVQLMEKAMGAVKSIEITRAVRSAQLDGLSIKKKQAIGFLDRALVAVGDSTTDVLNKTLARINLDESEVITIYYGAETEPDNAEQVGADLLERFPQLQVEVVRGDQPHYEYIISVE